MMLYICTKFCGSISKGFRVTDLNSTLNARVVANVDAGRTHGHMHEQTEIWLSAHPLIMLYILYKVL